MKRLLSILTLLLIVAGVSAQTQHDRTTHRAITTSGQITSSVATGTSPFVVSSTTKVTNLNVDRVDDFSAGPSSSVDQAHVGVAAYKTADETVASSITLQDDDHLNVTLVASTKYRFRFFLSVNSAGGGGGGIALGYTGTATATNFESWVKLKTSTSADWGRHAALSSTTSFSPAILGAGDDFFVVEGTIEVNAGGTFGLRWSQQTSSADTTTMRRGSYLEIVRMP